MVLEATMICIDNSEWMRNGDFTPTRMRAQTDAVSLLCAAITQSNPENTVGVLTMAGKGVRVLMTPTNDLGKILGCLHSLEVGGEANLVAGIQVAQLALKHRRNKIQQQRIIVFSGSPFRHETEALQMIGCKVKKNSVALDVVNFGEQYDGKFDKLEALVDAVNSNSNCNIVHVAVGSDGLSDVLISFSIFTRHTQGGSGLTAAAASGASDFDFGVDPDLDPELALALRVSMEEERARQEAAANSAAEEDAERGNGSQQSSEANNMRNDLTDDEEDDDDLLQKALAMSKDESP